jgi:FkbM family methyltransferase
MSKLPGFRGLTLIDIGAAGDIEPRWKKIEPILNFVGFEPDERSRALLLKSSNSCLSFQLLPFAVWDSVGSVSFNLCRKPEVSSIYAPNQQFLSLFPDFKRFDVISCESVKTTSLDDLGLETGDFIKLDIKGGELNALKGGQTVLESALGLEIEVEFSPLYINQPLFGEMCTFLSDVGFEFIDFVNFERWERDARNEFGQCVFGDALFLRSPETVIDKNRVDNELLSKYLGICLLYNRFDLLDRTLELLPEGVSGTLAEFLLEIKPIRRNNRLVRYIANRTSSVLSLFGVEYRSHLVY